MCGIYGITTGDQKFINDYMHLCKHRGPDGGQKIEIVNKESGNGVTLGHNLLSIMSEPKKSYQPWRTPKGNTLIYNGEIFNYFELKEKYPAFKDTTGCDTELLAWGLDKFGLKFIDELDSMHGFAYYETDKDKITLSRDHAGVKPLYYAEMEKVLVFGSEVKGMLDKVPGARKLDNLAASFQSRTGCNPLRNTLFSGIKQLLPGETLVYSLKDKKFVDSKRIYIVPNSNNKFNAKEFRQQVSDTVKRCAIGQRKIGIFLSGGLDSSVVAYELGKLQKINTFTNRMHPEVQGPEDYNSDANAAKILADKEGYTHHEVVITPKEYMTAWDQSIYYMEQVNFNPSMAMYCHTNKFMADTGIVVTMAGDMGDELLGGYPKYQKMFYGELPKTWRELLTMWLQRLKRPKSFTQDIIADEQLIDELEICYSDKLWNPDDPVGSYMALDCVTQCPAEFFSRNDTYGMAYSMEGRFPLASKTFMQYCLNIHTRYKLNQSDTKIMIRSAYNGILPNEIIHKSKTGWTVPVGLWLTKKLDKELEKFYTDSMGTDGLNTVTSSQKSAKMLIPDLILKYWKKTYKVQDA
jgi:asparagine synthase (glutamine-hydrolysing)